ITMLASAWPGAVAHATTAQRTSMAGHAVVQKEDNNNDNGDDGDNESGNSNDNTSGNGNNNESGNGNDNEHHEDVNVVPVPIPVSAPPPRPSGPSVSDVDEVSQCLS